jgi:multicomponent Na+:H+ antiporter subunit D
LSGFVSKSLVVHAAELSRQSAVVLLLQLASVGTFLSIGLKVPYLTWFGPERSIVTKPVPWNMYAGMVLAAGINLAIGLYPELLYRLMPFPVDYRPYTAAHLSETLQLLTFTGLAFWSVARQIHAEPLITLDFDWFYRRPAPVLYRSIVVSLDRLFGRAEEIMLDIARRVAAISRNPVAFAAGLPGKTRRAQADRESAFDEDRYRPPVGLAGVIVLFLSVALLVWSLFAL